MIRSIYLFIIVVIFHCSLLTASENPLIFIDDTTGIRLQSDPSFAIAPFSNVPPTGTAFKKLPGRKEALDIIAENDVWIKVEIFNPNSASEFALRVTGYPERIRIIAGGKIYDTSHPGKEELNANLYWPSLFINIPEGTSEIFLHSERKLIRTTIYSIGLLSKENVLNDRYHFLTHPDNQWTIYYLAAFCALLIFQLVYVIIQHYYHHAKEYIDYTFYLGCILLYFLIRFDMYYHSDIGIYNNAIFRVVLNNMLLLIPYVFYLRFARHFIGMKTKFPSMNRQISKVENTLLILVIPFLFCTISGSPKLSVLVVFVITIPLFLYTLYMIWYFYKRRNKLIGFLLLGSLCAATGHFLAMTTSFLHLNITVVPIYFTMAGLTFEIFFFNTGLGYKAKYEQEEKIKAQQVYIDQLDENRKMQENLQNMRNRIAGDLHDDVGSTLSSIGLYSQIASTQLAVDPARAQGILDKISSSSQRMMEAMSDIVWAIHSKNDEVAELSGRMRNFLNDRLSPNHINYSLEITDEAGNLELTMEAKRNLLLFFKEAINNAAKYSMATEIKSDMKIEKDFLLLLVQDNGRGFLREEVREGTGLHSMESRAAAMHGQLEIDSIPGNGTTLTLRVPVKHILMRGNHSN